MKRIALLFVGLALLLGSCSKKDDEVLNFIEINGAQKTLNVGYIYDNGTNNDITFRSYDLFFGDKKDNPADFIKFRIYSNSTTRLQEGTYNYSYYGYEKGNISWLSLGQNITYDSSNEKIGGNPYNKSNSDFSGSVTISQDDDVYKFVFDMKAVKDSNTYTIKGEFNEILQEGYVYTK